MTGKSAILLTCLILQVKKLIKTRTGTKEFTTVVLQLHPKSTGTIKLVSPDPYDYPVIQPNYFKDPNDFKSMIAGLCR